MDGFGLKVTTPPATLPVTIEEIRRQLRLPTTAEDDVLRTYAEAAVEHVQIFLNRQLLQATITLSLPRFPSGLSPIRTRRGPLISVTSISYIDTNGDAQTFTESGNWAAVIDTEPGEIRLVFDKEWPDTRVQPINPVTVVYLSGFGTQRKDVPADIRLAAIAASAHYFENRTLEGELPQAITNTLLPHVILDMRER